MRTRALHNAAIIGLSTLFATNAACNHGECDDTRNEDTNDVQEGEDTLVGAGCDPREEPVSCDLNGTNTVYCYAPPQSGGNSTWVDEPRDPYEPYCQDGSIVEPIECGGIGYTGIKNLHHRPSSTHPKPLRTLRRHHTTRP